MNLRPLAYFSTFMVLLAGTHRARAAATDSARLEYARTDSASNCPDRDALKAAVAKRLGYDPFLPAAQRTVVVEIANSEAGLQGQMRLVDAQGIIRGSRELSESAGHCDELVASLALAISIALDPSAAPDTTPDSAKVPAKVADTPSSPAALVVSSPVAPSPTVTPPSPTATPQHTDMPPRANVGTKRSPFAARASGFAALGAAPDRAFGVRLGASGTWDWFRLVAELSDQFPASKAQPYVGTVKASLLSVSLAPCIAYRSISGCPVFDFGSLHVRGEQILDSNDTHLFNATAGVRFEFVPALVGGLHLLTNVGVATALTPTTLKIHGAKVWESPVASATLGVGLGWQF